MAVADTILSMREVTKTYRAKASVVAALRDFSLDIAAGEFVAVRGSSGSGKTTALLAAAGLLSIDKGDVAVGGVALRPLNQAGRAALRAREVGFAFQQFHLIPYLSILENVMVPAMAAGAKGAAERGRELLERFGLAARLQHLPGQLSAGEQQRAAMARALVNSPRLLLADEPTGNLDESNAASVLDRIRQFAAEGGAVMLVTHDAAAAGRADRVVRLEQGSMA
jgi:putative ABC transport system ATP-binding protein